MYGNSFRLFLFTPALASWQAKITGEPTLRHKVIAIDATITETENYPPSGVWKTRAEIIINTDFNLDFFNRYDKLFIYILISSSVIPISDWQKRAA
jgi:hypothetical protein